MTITNESIQRAIEKLAKLDGRDQEVDHVYADKILLEFVPKEIADAYETARDRIGFWYA